MGEGQVLLSTVLSCPIAKGETVVLLGKPALCEPILGKKGSQEEGDTLHPHILRPQVLQEKGTQGSQLSGYFPQLQIHSSVHALQ